MKVTKLKGWRLRRAIDSRRWWRFYRRSKANDWKQRWATIRVPPGNYVPGGLSYLGVPFYFDDPEQKSPAE